MAEDKQMSAFKIASLEACKPLSENMKIWRKRRRMTQESMAEKTGIAVSSIREYEENKISVPLYSLLKISDVLDVSINELVGEDTYVEIDDDTILKEFKKLSPRMRYYVYEMLREINKY